MIQIGQAIVVRRNPWNPLPRALTTGSLPRHGRLEMSRRCALSRHFIALAALLALGGGLSVSALAEPGVAVDIVPDGTEAFEVPNTTLLRVNDLDLVEGLNVLVSAERRGGVITELKLRLALDRADLFKFRKGGWASYDLDDMSLMMFVAHEPVFVVAEASPALLLQINDRLQNGDYISAMVTEVNGRGFPLLFDLEDYIYEMSYQPRFDEEGS